MMSVVLPPSGEVARPHLALRVGLAAAEAIESCASEADVGIKWPNDLFIGPRKVGGVLCEALGKAVVAGIGINVRPVPHGLPDHATSLEVELGNKFNMIDLAGSLVDRLKRRVDAGAQLDSDTHAAIARHFVVAGEQAAVEGQLAQLDRVGRQIEGGRAGSFQHPDG